MKIRSSALLATLSFLLLTISGAARADVIYTLTPESVSGVTVTGSITTDGTTGVLSSSNIKGYSISLDMDWMPTETLANSSGAGFFIQGNYLTATASTISWNFAQGTGAEASLYGNSTFTQWHLYTDRIDVDFSGTEYAWYRGGTQQIALASVSAPVGVPEPGSLALLGIALAGMGWQRKRRA